MIVYWYVLLRVTPLSTVHCSLSPPPLQSLDQQDMVLPEGGEERIVNIIRQYRHCVNFMDMGVFTLVSVAV